jgi:predicted transcriptional regulator
LVTALVEQWAPSLAQPLLSMTTCRETKMVEDNALLVMTADIVQHYLQANKIAAADLPAFIRSIHDTLAAVGEAQAVAPAPVEKTTSAQIRKSITNAALISFIDQRPYRTLKRHITRHGMTPDEYKTKFSLPKDYPMVAPEYSAMRSEMAKSSGLGLGGRKPAKTAKRK